MIKYEYSKTFLYHGLSEQNIKCSVTMTGTGVRWDYEFTHDDVMKWKHFPRYWPFVRGIHRSPVNSPHKCQWRGVLMFSLIYAWIRGWVNNREAGDLRRHQAHYDVIVMKRHTTLPSWASHIVFHVGLSEMTCYKDTLPNCNRASDSTVHVLVTFNSLSPSDAYMCQETIHHWFR